MAQTGPAVPLQLGVTASIPTQLAPGQVLAGVVLKNLSAFALQVQLGSFQFWVAPFSSEPFPQSQLGTITVTPVNVGAPTGAGLNYVLPTYYGQGEQLPAAAPLSPGQASASVPRVGISVLVTGTGAPNAVSVIAAPGGSATQTVYYLNWHFVPTTAALGAPPVGLYECGFQTSAGGTQVITALGLYVATVVGGLCSPDQAIDAWAHPIVVGATGSGNGLNAVATQLPTGGAVLILGIVEYVNTQ